VIVFCIFSPPSFPLFLSSNRSFLHAAAEITSQALTCGSLETQRNRRAAGAAAEERELFLLPSPMLLSSAASRASERTLARALVRTGPSGRLAAARNRERYAERAAADAAEEELFCSIRFRCVFFCELNSRKNCSSLSLQFLLRFISLFAFRCFHCFLSFSTRSKTRCPIHSSSRP